MSDFFNKFHHITDFVQGSAKSIMSKLDHFTFSALVNLLKSNDYEAVKTAIEQLAKEKRPESIPPLFFVAKEHPNEKLREKAWHAIDLSGERASVDKLTAGKKTEDAVKSLIQHYGNYRQS